MPKLLSYLARPTWLRPTRLHYLHFVLFLLLLAGQYAAYYEGRMKTHFNPPQVWRQTDTYSMALRFYHGEASLLRPRLHNVLNKQKKGYIAPEDRGRGAGECPWLYYGVGQVFQLTGPNLFTFRLIWLGLFTAGMMALFWLCFRFTGHLLAALAVPLLLFTAPTLAFYAPNFVGNAPAFSLMWLGLAALVHHFDRTQAGAPPRIRLLWLGLGLLCFTLAGLTKVTELITLFAITGLLVMNWAWQRILGRPSWLPAFPMRQPAAYAIGLLLTVGLVAAWYGHAIQYNAQHNTTYFQTSTLAIWSLSPGQIDYVISEFRKIWHDFFLYKPFWYLLPLLLALCLGFARRLTPEVLALLGLLLLGTLGYIALWFLKFAFDEYYFIEVYPLVAFILIGGFQLFLHKTPRLAQHWLPWLLILALIGAGTLRAHRSFAQRNSIWAHERVNPRLLEGGLDAFLAEKGVGRQDLVYSYPDPTPNYSLVTMHLIGYTNYNFSPKHGDGIPDQPRQPLRKILMPKQVDYIIVHDTATLQAHRAWFRGCLQDTLGHYRDVYLFRAPSADTLRAAQAILPKNP
jgi:hypothetical protein